MDLLRASMDLLRAFRAAPEPGEDPLAYGDLNDGGNKPEHVQPHNREDIDHSSQHEEVKSPWSFEGEEVLPMEECEEVNSSSGEAAVNSSDAPGEVLTLDKCGEREGVNTSDGDGRTTTRPTKPEHQQTTKRRYYLHK
jgi:hypothetical protein